MENQHEHVQKKTLDMEKLEQILKPIANMWDEDLGHIKAAINRVQLNLN